MIILAVDTTTLAGSVALLDKTKLLSEVNIDTASTYSERLLPSIDFLLQRNKLNIKEIDAFAVAAGPGSFTGIRIGLSTIKSFAYASGKSVAPVSTLEALAFKLHHSPGRLLCPALDAKKGQIFAGLFESGKPGLKEIIAQGAYTPDQFFAQLPSHRLISFIGSGIHTYQDKILRYFKDKARFSHRTPFIAYEVGLLGYELLRKRKGVNSQELKPLYFRRSQAEEKD
ncbi:MAG: tRNA (adenosine(37)-N6)-threonylcarbamoyltransferase complex dimerization subunit type 1 TsaB [Candidatus Aminicenantes bacterium]|nr:tRNA (adenosine(37)-N6)-threonylcarbamoyltransferase complex dimerization subunit type 1 TsaB [Candidatus Aminicenantes bacterium]